MFFLFHPCEFRVYPLVYKNRGNSFGIATGHGLDARDSGLRFPVGTVNFSLHHRVQTDSEAHPASYEVGTGGISPAVKRPTREAGD